MQGLHKPLLNFWMIAKKVECIHCCQPDIDIGIVVERMKQCIKGFISRVLQLSAPHQAFKPLAGRGLVKQRYGQLLAEQPVLLAKPGDFPGVLIMKLQKIISEKSGD